VLSFTLPFPADMALIASPGLYGSEAEQLEEALLEINDLISQRVPAAVSARGFVVMGNAPNEIVCAADDNQIDLIVIGTHGLTGWRHLAFGSVTESVVRMAHRPVLTVHGGPVPVRDEQSEALLPTRATG